MKFFVVIAPLFAVASAQQPPWTNCASGPTDMTVLAFTVSPYPLGIGQNVYATATGVLNAPIIMSAKVSVSGNALIFATVAADQLPSWTNCATGPTAITVTSFSVSPYPLCIGLD
ncbi:hypothetical protein BG000_008206, partial [Podila horticola]